MYKYGMLHLRTLSMDLALFTLSHLTGLPVMSAWSLQNSMCLIVGMYRSIVSEINLNRQMYDYELNAHNYSTILLIYKFYLQ